MIRIDRRGLLGLRCEMQTATGGYVCNYCLWEWILLLCITYSETLVVGQQVLISELRALFMVLCICSKLDLFTGHPSTFYVSQAGIGLRTLAILTLRSITLVIYEKDRDERKIFIIYDSRYA